jgi:thiol-disulfide isomerase/thioredoxin
MKTLCVVLALIGCVAIGWVVMTTPTPASATGAPSAAPSPAAQPAATDTASATVSPFVKQFTGHLVSMDRDGNTHDFDASALKGVKYWAFYYSASWCPPCRAFTPSLVDFYKSFKATHPNFELIFVNDDQSEDDMLAYMKSDSMTWPAVRYADIDFTNAKKYMGSGIPDLVLTDANGKVLSDSFNGETYLGPQKVMGDIQTMVQ